MKPFAVVALALIFAPAALAQHQAFAVNPDASEVKITLNTTHEVVNGTFHIKFGSIEFDRSATLLGTAHDLTIPMQIHVDGSKATAKAQFIVPYVQWGLKNPSFMFWKAQNDVAIDLALVGQVSN